MSSRRKFLKKSGMAVLSLPFVGSACSSPAEEAVTKAVVEEFTGRKLKIGLIGCGSRGSGISKLLKESPRFDIRSCCDVLPFRLEQLTKLTGAKGYTDYRALLDDPELEAVIVATPFGMHGQMALDTMQAGKHLYCEKTMVQGMDELQQVLDGYKATSNLVFQTGHQYNSSQLYQNVFELVRSGYLGPITAIECQWNRNGDWRREVPDPKWERLINWRLYRENSGGLLAELCSHQIDFICRALDDTPKKIAGFGGIDHWKDGRETFDNVHVLYEFNSGIDASFTCTTTNAYESYQIKILGEKATIVMKPKSAEVYLEKKQIKEYGDVDGVSGATMTAWQKGEGVPVEADTKNITLQAFEQFYQSIFAGESVFADIKSGAITSKCVQMSLDALHEEKITYWEDYEDLRF